MAEHNFRLIPADRALAWTELGWLVISGNAPLRWPAGNNPEVVIVEWVGEGEPVLPEHAESFAFGGE